MPAPRNAKSKPPNTTKQEGTSLEELGKASNPEPTNSTGKRKRQTPKPCVVKRNVLDPKGCKFVGDPILILEAHQKWPHRYEATPTKTTSSTMSETNDQGGEILFAKCHYQEADIYGDKFYLGDDAEIEGEKGEDNYIGRIIEFFETTDGRLFFTSQWFFKAADTDIGKDHCTLVHEKRVFISEYKNDNPLDCLLSRLAITKVSISMDQEAKKNTISSCDFFYDMQYSKSYSTFCNLTQGCDASSTISTNVDMKTLVGPKFDSKQDCLGDKPEKSEMTLLDLYAGCGAMSTGLCFGAATSGVNLVTRWAVDFNEYACESLRKNHSNIEVRNEKAEDFLSLLKEWKNFCEQFSLLDTNTYAPESSLLESDDIEDDKESNPSGELEVQKLVDICVGDPYKKNETALYFKVRWRGFGPKDDTWEPLTNLQNCKRCIQDFVVEGHKRHILPLPGDVDVICGGPPCQGISGYNRFRNKDAPLDDDKNVQIEVFMDIIEYLRPKYILMENVVDILKFSSGFLIRYALGRLITLDYQARMGLLAAGSYGLPQFRMRMFLWGAFCTEKLPPFPLPTHKVVNRGAPPKEFEQNVVAFDNDCQLELEKAVDLGDAISDLPHVKNDEKRDIMQYGKAPLTKFQRSIRSKKQELMGIDGSYEEPSAQDMLYDHRPFELNNDDYQRVCQIPKRKGANFRDLRGVRVGPDNKVELDPAIPRIYLESDKPLVPDYAIQWKDGNSSEPFGRLWWDETVPTVVTRPQPHNRIILHPTQDRILTLRENARLQGFPDFYRFYGPMKQRYIQVGNAVAVPVARALGHVLGVACQGSCGDDPLYTLPSKFSRFGEKDD